MDSTDKRVVELKGYPEGGLSLLPAIRQAVQEVQPSENQQLWDIGISRHGSRIFLHLYYKPVKEGAVSQEL